MLSLFEIAALLLVLSAILSWLNRAYFKLPHTIGLLVMALLASFGLLGLEAVMPSVGLTDTLQSALKQIDFNETLMKGMLGFLLFAGALHVDFGKIRDAKWAIGSMATLGVIMSTFIVGTGFYFIAKLLGEIKLEYDQQEHGKTIHNKNEEKMMSTLQKELSKSLFKKKTTRKGIREFL